MKGTKTFSAKQVARLNKRVNKKLNRLSSKMKITSGEYQGYSVVYDLGFVDGGNLAEAKDNAKNDSYEGNSIGNVITIGSSKNPYFAKKVVGKNADGEELTQQVGGATTDMKLISMNPATNTAANQDHEVFHTLGMEHPKGKGAKSGIMAYPPQNINQDDTNFVGNGSNGFLPAVEKNKNDK